MAPPAGYSAPVSSPVVKPLLDTDIESLDMSPRRTLAVTGGVLLRPIAEV